MEGPPAAPAFLALCRASTTRSNAWSSSACSAMALARSAWTPRATRATVGAVGTTTRIAWADATFNPWVGCLQVSPACDHCYAAALAHRYGWHDPAGLDLWDAHAARGRTSAENWRQPIRWDRAARAVGERRRVFTGSMCDIFDNRAPEAWRADLWRLIAATPDLTGMLLTKRPQNIAGMLPPDWGAGWRNVWLAAPPRTKLRRRSASRPCLRYRPPRCGFYQSSRCWRRSTSVAGSVQGFGARDRGKKFHRRGPVTARPVVLRSAAALFFCASGTAVIICSECQRLASARASWLTAS